MGWKGLTRTPKYLFVPIHPPGFVADIFPNISDKIGNVLCPELSYKSSSRAAVQTELISYSISTPNRRFSVLSNFHRAMDQWPARLQKQKVLTLPQIDILLIACEEGAREVHRHHSIFGTVRRNIQCILYPINRGSAIAGRKLIGNGHSTIRLVKHNDGIRSRLKENWIRSDQEICRDYPFILLLLTMAPSGENPMPVHESGAIRAVSWNWTLCWALSTCHSRV